MLSSKGLREALRAAGKQQVLPAAVVGSVLTYVTQDLFKCTPASATDFQQLDGLYLLPLTDGTVQQLLGAAYSNWFVSLALHTM